LLLLFLLPLFLFSLVLRWTHLDQNLFFGFEQGRDATIIQNIVQHHEFKLVGPQTDIVGVFHGAYYYYLMVIPWALSHGDPLALSFFLVLLSSFVPIIAYFFGKAVFQDKKWAMLLALLVAISYEFIIYSRWLSNVTPAIPFIFLTYYFLWLYKEKQKVLFFGAAVVCAAAAAQCEIILVMLFGFAFLLLLVLRIIPFPGVKNFLLSFILAGMLFTPHLIFNLRNQNILFVSILHFLTQGKGGSPNVLGNLQDFVQTYTRIFRQTLSLAPGYICMIPAIVLVTGLGFTFKKSSKTVFFFLVWAAMPLPIILFHDVARLLQLYIGVGGAILFLSVLAVQKLWQCSAGKVAVLVCGALLVLGCINTVQNLRQNRDVFFITVQEGMNYADQQKLLTYINTDAHGQIYRFVAYTIPYLHPEGWQYLQHHFYPHTTDDGSKTVYIAIEKQVEPFWQQKWTDELGTSKLVDEKTFGLLRVQKRQLLSK